MPLQPCRECRTPLSTEANTCVKCGCPDPHGTADAAAFELFRRQQQLRSQAYTLCGGVAVGVALWILGLAVRLPPLSLLGLLIVAGFALVLLGGLPGAIARGNAHPQARAIAIMGWLGLLGTFGVFWLVALVWAHTHNTAAQSARHHAGVHRIG